jgi:Ca2+-binding EF-hand superfamily protein
MSFGYGNYGAPRGAPPAGGPPAYDQSYGGAPGGGYGGAHGYGGGGPGGFSQPPPAGPPPGSDPQLWNWFVSVDTDRSGAISVTELQKALINGDWSPFDLDTVKLLMSIFDTDRSGTIGFNEFAGLWRYVKDWQNVFRHFDKDRSGSIDSEELHAALKQFGYNLSPQLLTEVEKKYDFKGSGVADGPSIPSGPGGFGRPPVPSGITFDRFVRACVVIKQLTEAFQKIDSDRDGWIQINYDQFMHIVLAAP